MIYTDAQHAWLDRRAKEIAEERDWPFHVARSEAMAEMARNNAEVIPIKWTDVD
jgi:hypothetical protein